ncbi:MAG TPA: YceI family protein [bacterium]|jgi:polyisoprenoid-binding protein YceI
MKKLFLSVSLLIATVAMAQSATFKVVAGDVHTLVQFESKASLETVTGKTRTATGFAELDGGGGRAEVHVDLASLRTGISKRDQDMREQFLQTKQYPEAVFTVTTLQLPATGLQENARTRVSVKGNLTLHGTTREVEPETYLTLGTGGQTLRIESAFLVKLQDYTIERPQFLLLRLAEEQHISVDITAVSDNRGETSRQGGN